MDFFALSGIQLPESFRRHDSDGRFVPLCEVTADTRGNVDTICSRLAGCVFPDLAESVDPELTGLFRSRRILKLLELPTQCPLSTPEGSG